MAATNCNGNRQAPKRDHSFSWDKALRKWRCWGCGRTTSKPT